MLESCEEGEGQLEQGTEKKGKVGRACRSDNRPAHGPAAHVQGGWVAGTGEAEARRGEQNKAGHLLVAVLDFYAFAAGVLLGLVVAVLFVDADLFAKLRLRLRLWAAGGAVFKNAYLFGVGLAALSRLDGWELCLCFYL